MLENRAAVLAGMARAVRVTGRSGPVDVFALVDRGGEVRAVRLAGELDDPVLGTMARTVALAMRFVPARRGGEPVPSWTHRRLVFSRAGGVGGAAVTTGSAPDSVLLPRVDSALAADRAPPRGARTLELAIDRSPPLILLDGTRLEEPEDWSRLEEIRFEELRSVEYLEPKEARRRYGPAGRNGAVFLTTGEPEDDPGR